MRRCRGGLQGEGDRGDRGRGAADGRRARQEEARRRSDLLHHPHQVRSGRDSRRGRGGGDSGEIGLGVLLALSTWWYVGWVIAGAVVLIAAVLLLAIIAVGNRIVRQADDITEALDGTRRNTDPLWGVKQININIDRINRGLAAARKALTG